MGKNFDNQPYFELFTVPSIDYISDVITSTKLLDTWIKYINKYNVEAQEFAHIETRNCAYQRVIYL